LPGFLSPNVAKVIVDAFGLKQTTDADSDIAAMFA
jgi:hydroxylamine reductase (hybrid-cluster protein)